MSAKVGSQLWGVSHSVPKKTLILGADVFHERGKKSCAALVAQFGSKLDNYYSVFRYNQRGQEIIN